MAWEQLTSLELSTEDSLTQPIRINNHEFIIIVYDETTVEIRKYSIKTNTWSTIHTHKTDNLCDKTFYDPHSNSVYIIAANIYIINLDTKETKEVESPSHIYRDARISLIDKSLHIINEDGYSIMDINTIKINDVGDIAGTEGITHGALIGLKSRDILLSIGGFCAAENKDIDRIYKYSFSNDKQWKLLSNIKLPTVLSSFCCISSMDEKYIFILGGSIYNAPKFDHSHQYDILIYDLDKQQIRLSLVKLPNDISTDIIAISMNGYDEKGLLTDGYIRHNVKDISIIPLDIIQFIKQFVYMEYIYLMQEYDDDFWRISVDDILAID